MRKTSAAIAMLLAATNAAYAAGPSLAEVDRCVRGRFDNKDPALFRNPANPRCPAYMELLPISITDMSVSGNYAEVKVSLQYRLIQDVSGYSFVAESCALGHYGDQNQMYPAGSRWHNTDTIRMQKWTSGWKC